MHHFIDFKSFKHANISLAGPLTILVGPNGSGKSNALEGIEVLASIASGAPLHEITDLDREGALNVRGGLQGCPRYGNPSFTLGFSANLPWFGQLEPTRYSVTVAPLPTPRIGPEYLMVGDTMVLKEAELGDSVSAGRRVQYKTFGTTGREAHAAVSATRSALSQYESFATQNKKLAETLESIADLRSHLRTPFVLDPVAKGMRGYERMGHDSLLRNGSNLSSVLHGLSKHENGRLDELFSHIRRVPDEPYDSFAFATTDVGDVMFAMREEHSQNLSYARLLSDGTLRTLAILTAVATRKRHSSVVVEEFDNGLHPSRVESLLQAIAHIAKTRNINVLLSTHNPVVLDALTFEQQRSVVLAFRSKEDYCSRLLPLSDVARFHELLARGRLGDLVTRRIVDQYLDPDFEEKRAQAMDRWVAGLFE